MILGTLSAALEALHAFPALPFLLVYSPILVLLWWHKRPDPRPLTRAYTLHRIGGWCRSASGWHSAALTGGAVFFTWLAIVRDWGFDILPAVTLSTLVGLLAAGGTSTIHNYIAARLAPALIRRRLPPAWVKKDYRLPPVPFDHEGPTLILGEVHPGRKYFRDGSWRAEPRREPGYSPVAEYLALPWRSLVTGLLILGNVGQGKTAHVLRPSVFPLLAHASRPGGLVLDSKASLVEPLRAAMAACERTDDLLVVGPASPVKWNPIHLPAATPATIAENLMATKANLNGAEYKADARWIRAGAATLIEAAIGLGRLTQTDCYVTAMFIYGFLNHLQVLVQDADRPGEIVSDFVLKLAGGTEPSGREEEYRFYRDRLVSRFSEAERFLGIYISEVLDLLVRLVDPAVRHLYCPPLAEINMPSWPEMIDRGFVAVLDCNAGERRDLSLLLATALKLSYMTAMEARPSLTRQGIITDDRCMLLVCDEYQQIATPSDAVFVGISRESKSINVFATQGLISLEERLGENVARTITQSMLNRVVLSCGDGSEKVAQWLGQEEITDLTRTIQEGQHQAHMTLAGKLAGDSTVAETLSEQRRREFVLKPEEIKRLPVGTAFFEGTDGRCQIPAQRVYLPFVLDKPGIRHADTSRALQIEGGRYV